MTGPSTRQWGQVIAESRGRAQRYLATAPLCDKCGSQVATWGRTRHSSCESGTIVGHSCTCPEKCSDSHWGNGPNKCDPRCVPCQRMKGQPLEKRRRVSRG